MPIAEKLDLLLDDLFGSTAAGDCLAPIERALVQVGLCASVACLDEEGTRAAMRAALSAGASVEQIQEILSLISALGVHSLMLASADLLELGEAAGSEFPLDEERKELWNKFVGDDPYWAEFEAAFPGFLESMLRLSIDQFKAFHMYCAIPWKSGTVSARTKELVAIASDATPAHTFFPGLRLHLHNAIKLGVGRGAIEQALDMAANTHISNGPAA